MEKYKSLFMPGAVLGAGALIAVSIFTSGGITIAPGDGGDLTGSVNPPALPSFEITDNDYIRGNVDAPITILEFSDFQCPFCRQFHPVAQQALAEYGDQVRWVYRHFPLDNIHPEARPSAEASECVAEQKGADGFWQFVDAMFASQDRLGNDFYREVAEQIGVDLEQFDECVTTRKYADKVQADMQNGIDLGITGTPGGFINATQLRGAIPYANLKAIIEAELEKL